MWRRSAGSNKRSHGHDSFPGRICTRCRKEKTDTHPEPKGEGRRERPRREKTKVERHREETRRREEEKGGSPTTSMITKESPYEDAKKWAMMMMMIIDMRSVLAVHDYFQREKEKLEKIYPRHFIRRRRLYRTPGRTRMIAMATALQTKAAEKHESIRKAVEGGSSRSNESASAAADKHKPPRVSLLPPPPTSPRFPRRLLQLVPHPQDEVLRIYPKIPTKKTQNKTPH